MKTNKGYENYRKIAKELKKKDLRILSGRYEFVKNKYKYICNDILQKLEIKNSDDIFDIGTGDGRIISFLSKKSKSTTTIDSPEIINKINKKKNIKYLKGNIHEEGKKIKKKFDKILVYSVIQYFYNLNEVIKFINLCLRLLKNTGSILIGDIPNEDMNSRYKKTKKFKVQSKLFDKKRKSHYSKIDEIFFNLPTGKNIIFRDKHLLFLLKKFNTLKHEAYILPQNQELPYSVKRVDLLIRKRS